MTKKCPDQSQQIGDLQKFDCFNIVQRQFKATALDTKQGHLSGARKIIVENRSTWLDISS